MITATHIQQRTRAVEVIEDVEWLIGTDHPDSIGVRLGYRDALHLADALRRWGRPDLTSRLKEAR